ncbi:MAG: PAS domain-containing protein [Erythrobacter sp.]|jgi:two-component sensor histidine kinase|nr:PAS domain-containing protein [Erythrobacter sp.]
MQGEGRITEIPRQLWPVGERPLDRFESDERRLSVLARFDADALDGDPELAQITRFAAKLCDTPIAAVSMVEEERQRFLASEGLEADETPRSTSFCERTMRGGEILEVLDARTDPTFHNYTLVTGKDHLRFYAGAPLVSSEGAPLGALCVIDTKPRTAPLTQFQREGLTVLAQAVKRRLYAHRQERVDQANVKATRDRLQFVLDSLPDIAWSAAPGPSFDFYNAQFERTTGRPPPVTIEEWRTFIHPEDFEETSSKFGEAIANAQPFEDEWRLLQADGSYRYVLSRALPSSEDPATARWFGTVTDIDDSYRTSQERELLAGELAHRIKNIFSVITGLVTLHARGDATLKLFADTLTDNIRALSRAQEFALRIDTHSEDELKGLLNVLMAPYGIPGESAVSITGDVIAIGHRAATPLALVFHELATNSAKYGALSVEQGRVAIEVARSGDDVWIAWQEHNGPKTNAPTQDGFGSRLMHMAIEHQLGGTIALDWRSEGLQTRITIPKDRLAQ